MSAGRYLSYREPSPGGAESNGIGEPGGPVSGGGPVGATNQLVDPETLYTKQNAIGVLHCCGKSGSMESECHGDLC
jgi:hypothetical protein